MISVMELYPALKSSCFWVPMFASMPVVLWHPTDPEWDYIAVAESVPGRSIGMAKMGVNPLRTIYFSRQNDYNVNMMPCTVLYTHYIASEIVLGGPECC
jgi:hypothetical protein